MKQDYCYHCSFGMPEVEDDTRTGLPIGIEVECFHEATINQGSKKLAVRKFVEANCSELASNIVDREKGESGWWTKTKRMMLALRSIHGAPLVVSSEKSSSTAVSLGFPRK